MKNISTYGLQKIGNINLKKIRSSLTKNIITNSDLCLKFEKKLTNFTGSKYSVACNNGTSALMMAIIALQLKNTIAIIPNINFVAVANIIALLKGRIIFCDVNYHTGMIDKKSLIKILKTCKKKGIKPNLLIAMDYAGNSCDIESIYKICKKENSRYKKKFNMQIR